MTYPYSRILERVDEGADALEPDPHLLPILDEPLRVSGPSDAARRAHLNDGALLESRALTQEGYRLSAAEDHVPAGKLPPVNPELMVDETKQSGHLRCVGLLDNLARQNPLQVEMVRVNLSSADQDRTDRTRLVETLAEAPVSLDEHSGHPDLVLDLPLGIGKLKLPG
jgi:hypothetical protein